MPSVNLLQKRTQAENPAVTQGMARLRIAIRKVEEASASPDGEGLSCALTEFADAKDSLERLRENPDYKNRIDLFFGSLFQ